MKSLVFAAASPYTAYIGSGAIGLLPGEIQRFFSGSAAAIVTDDGVPASIVKRAAALAEQAGFRAPVYTMRAGESGKKLEGLRGVYSFLYDNRVTRSDGVIAVGGGVVGDIAGFAAATYLRGLPFVNVATTIIAQTDSAYGGKTGVDFAEGKNHVGCFYDPKAVICDADHLSTLSEAERANGMGEVIKYGAIASPELLASVTERGRALPDGDIIASCAEIKRRFVEQDEYDLGVRRALNFGHTIGHAIEAASAYTVPHGQAVAYGMLAAAHLGSALGVTEPNVESLIKTAAEAVGLDTDWKPKAQAALPLVARDKKNEGGEIAFVLPVTIGETIIKKLPVSVIWKRMG